MPAPIGLAKSSPVPTATGVPRGSPVSSAPALVTALRRPQSRRRSGQLRGRRSNSVEQVVGIAALFEPVEHGGRGERVIDDGAAAESRARRKRPAGARSAAVAARARCLRSQRIFAAICVASSTRPVGHGSARGSDRDLGLGAPVHPDDAGRERSAHCAPTGTQPSSWPETAIPLMSARRQAALRERARNAGCRASSHRRRVLLGPAGPRESYGR